MLVTFESLAMVVVLVTAPVPRDVARAGPCPRGEAAVRPGSPIPWAERYRLELRRHTNDRSVLRRLAVGVGAALAWDAADLPRHRAPGVGPIGDFEPGALFSVPRFALPQGIYRPGGAIGALITRWDTLYPPYALTHDIDVMDDR